MYKKPRILLADDEKSIRDVIKLNLEIENYEVKTVKTGAEALKLFKSQRFDIILLDVMMPELSGFDVCHQIRLTDQEVPIIFLTAKNQTKDRIIGLRKGADDYLAKPFSLEELSLRIRNLLRRSNNGSQSPIEDYAFGDNKINFKSYEAHNDNGRFLLTQKEALLLKLLIENKNEVVSRNAILENVWGYDVFPSTRTIDNFIVTLRKYFEKDPKYPQYIISVRGVGYKFIER